MIDFKTNNYTFISTSLYCFVLRLIVAHNTKITKRYPTNRYLIFRLKKELEHPKRVKHICYALALFL